MRWLEKYKWIILGFVLFRLMFVPFMGLMPQGAYYSFYSDHLDWSYYDHPPMIAYFLSVAFAIFGKSVWVVKLMTWSMAIGTLLVVFKLSEHFVSEENRYKAIAVISSTLMMSILSLVATPDVPLLFFWSLSIYLLHKAIFLKKSWYWILGGICMGLAFDSKYTAVVLPICLFVFLVFSNEKRYLLKTIWPYLSGLCMLILMTPVIYWNIEHDFASFAFQGAQRAQTIADEGWKPEHIFGSIAMQSTVLIPVLFIFIFISLFQYFKQSFKAILDKTKDLYLLSFFLPVFGGFMMLSIMYWVKLNWIMPAYLTGILFLAPRMSKKWYRAQIIFSIVLHALVALQLATYSFPVKSDDTWYGWETLAEQVEERMSEHPDAFVFAGDHYKTTAQLGFFIEKDIYAHNVVGSHSVQYDMVQSDFTHLNGRDALYVDSDPSLRFREIDSKRLVQLKAYFQDVKIMEPILISSKDDVVRYFRVYYCSDYTFSPGYYKRPIVPE